MKQRKPVRIVYPIMGIYSIFLVIAGMLTMLKTLSPLQMTVIGISWAILFAVLCTVEEEINKKRGFSHGPL